MTDFRAPKTVEIIRGLKLLVFDFDGVFTDNAVWVSEEGTEFVRCSRFDGIGLSKLRRRGLDMMVLSTEVNPVVTQRCKKLKLPCVQGCDDKLAEIKRIAAQRDIALSEIAFMGNDINDAEVLAVVGLPVVPADAHGDVYSLGQIVTRKPGGHGAVRELCDYIDEVLA